MRFSVLPLLCGVHIALACSENNCLRALIASAFPSRTASADCSSYLMTTVTPATVTYTATVSATFPDIVPAATTETDTVTYVTTLTVSDTSTIDVTDVITSFTFTPVKRQVTVVPSNVPAYASACSGAVKYASACSCIGVSAVTITAPAPSTTITVSTTSTSTSTSTSTFTTLVTSFTPVTSTIEETTTVSISTTTTDVLPCGTDSPNIVPNGAFDSDYAGWGITETGSGAVYHDGGCSPDYYCPLLFVGYGPGSVTFAQILETVPGTEYTLSYYYLPPGPVNGGAVGATIGCAAGSTTLSIDFGAPAYSWAQASTTFVATDYTTNLTCYAECSTDGCVGSVNYDDVSVVANC